MVATIILAAGLRKRSNVQTHNVLEVINNYPIIYYHIKQALAVHSSHILIVVGKYKELIQEVINGLFPQTTNIFYIEQKYYTRHNMLKVLGTANAILSCFSFFQEHNIYAESNILIMTGDGPLLNIQTLNSLLQKPNSILTENVFNPTGYGRIIMNEDNVTLSHIIEEKECTTEEHLLITHINCGVYNIQLGVLTKFLPMITNNNMRKEYYLTDIVGMGNDGFINFINICVNN